MYSTAKTGVILNYYIDGQKVGSAALTPTGSNYALSNTTISMAPGTHILRVEIAAGGTDVGAFDWFRFVAT